MIETATGLSQKLNAEISEIREKQRNVKCQKRKLIEKRLGEVLVPTKQPRLCASVPKHAAKKKSKKKSNIKTEPQQPIKAVVKALLIKEFPNASA